MRADAVIDCVLIAVCIGVDESVTVSVTAKVWAPVKTWVTISPDTVEPSPKSHVIAYGVFPPVAVDVNVTGCVAKGVVVETVKLADSG